MASTIKLKDIVRGTTRAIDVTFKQADNTPYDLTGATVRFVGTLEDDPSNDIGAAINVHSTSHTDPTNGQTRITLSPTNTNIAPDQYNVGIQATLLSGEVIEKTGTVTITQDYAKTTP